MIVKFLVAATVAVLALGTPAQASTVTTLSFSGSLYSAYDGKGLFGPVNTSYGSSTAFSATIAYDPLSLGPCSSPPSGCGWTLTSANSVTETLTINAHTVTFNVTSGQLNFQTGGGSSQQITLTPLGGTGFSLYNQFGDGSSFFGNPANLSPQLNFGAVTLAYGSGGGNDGSTSFNLNFRTVSAATVTTGTVATPEPVSFTLLAAGLAGLGLVRRRSV